MLRTSHHCEAAASAKRRSGSTILASVAAGLAILIGAGPSVAGEAGPASLRVLTEAVVAFDEVTIGDVCAVDARDAIARDEISSVRLAAAPEPGGSRILHADAIRAALRAADWNVAAVTIHGSAQCTVRRPASLNDDDAGSTPRMTDARRPRQSRAARTSARENRIDRQNVADDASTGVRIRGPQVARRTDRSPETRTLRNAIEAHFADLHKRYGGRVELAFDRASEHSLDLSGPRYSFEVRQTRGDAIGLTSLDVRLLEDGRHAQTIPMAVDVALRLPVVVATGPINQNATITRGDVDTVEMTFRRLDRTGLRDPRDAIGRRAKRFVEAGAIIDPTDLEQVPLVTRGQLVTLISQVGSARIVASGKALEDGLPGQLIRVRSADNRRIEFDAVVTGPGTARIGTTPAGLTQLSSLQGVR